MANKIDPNAITPNRIRRNFQRLARGGANTSIRATAPLLNTSGTLSLTLLAAGGLQVTTNSLSLKLVDTSLVLAAGGVGVNLAASSGLSIASGLKVSLLTTKGDLFTFSTVNARLGVGTNGQFLVADSTQTTGLVWLTISTRFVYNETPSGTQNSVNTAFTLATAPVTGTVAAYKNGLRLKPTTDFSISTNTITYVVAPAPADVLLVDYQK
jgi:hypothetical protein